MVSSLRKRKEEYDNITNQSKEINLKYLTNSPDGFIYVQSKAKLSQMATK